MGTVQRFLARSTSGSSKKAHSLLQENSVPIVSDHLFFSEGAMENPVNVTEEHPIKLKSYERTWISHAA